MDSNFLFFTLYHFFQFTIRSAVCVSYFLINIVKNGGHPLTPIILQNRLLKSSMCPVNLALFFLQPSKAFLFSQSFEELIRYVFCLVYFKHPPVTLCPKHSYSLFFCFIYSPCLTFVHCYALN